MRGWIIGLFISVGAGTIVTGLFLGALRGWMGFSKAMLKGNAPEVPSWLTGVIERLFFTVLVGVDTPGAPAYMLTWLGLKMATNWNHPAWKEAPHAMRSGAVSALLAGLISMLFALWGGWAVHVELFK
jgi:hypothetical protein